MNYKVISHVGEFNPGDIIEGGVLNAAQVERLLGLGVITPESGDTAASSADEILNLKAQVLTAQSETEAKDKRVGELETQLQAATDRADAAERQLAAAGDAGKLAADIEAFKARNDQQADLIDALTGTPEALKRMSHDMLVAVATFEGIDLADAKTIPAALEAIAKGRAK